MIPGLSGSLLSHDALAVPDPTDGACTTEADDLRRSLGRWHAELGREGGPAWSARSVFDRVLMPFCAALGFHVVPRFADAACVHALVQSNSVVVAAALATPWGRGHAASWQEAVRHGIGAGVRWCFCFNGPSLCLFDARRTHSRRFAELDLAAVASDPATFALVWRLLRGATFATTPGTTSLDDAVEISERYRTSVRQSLQEGVHEALGHLTSAFLAAAARRSRSATHKKPGASAAFEEALVVIYRVLFLLFAEARGLVPVWHPIYRDGYTVEALRPAIETRPRPRGVWETLQAIARLAHRGCRADTLRVPPFNGRLFSPAHAPLADLLSLDDTSVREALLALTTRRAPAGRQRIAYADLGVEQLGGVYERVLDFEVAQPAAGGPCILVRGGRRKTTGTFYTPRSLTEYVVRRTLAPLVEGAGPDHILRLRVLDPAMGSGAFLVAACRYLAHAYENALVRAGTLGSSDVGELERAGFRRAVAQRCLFGVDLNPMAVQLARLSLWLATLSGDRPLTFFDHHLRTGNSLVGAAVTDVSRMTSGGRRRTSPLPLFDVDALDRALGVTVSSQITLRDGLEDTLAQVRSKERLFATVSSEAGPLARWKRIADLWCAGWFDLARTAVTRGMFSALLDGSLSPSVAEPLLKSATDVARRERFFHWTLEFPEIFFATSGAPLPDAGFDAVLGNPPWEMVRADTGSSPSRTAASQAASSLTRFTRDSGVYRAQSKGHANLYQMFVERALSLVRRDGRVGLVVPSGIGTDHGCAGLRRYLLDSTRIDSFLSVENREALFPIHRGLKFVVFTTTAGGSTRSLSCRFGLRAASEFDRLPETGADPAAVSLPRDLLERLTGEQLAIPELRTQADAALASRLAFLHRPTGDVDGWGLTFGRELNATDDRGHFNTEQRGLPVVEGKHLNPFQVALPSTCHHITAAKAARLIDGERTFNRRRLAYRDVASSTNRLTLIAAVLPAGVLTTHTLFCLKSSLDDLSQQFLCGMFNSFVANYLVRLRVTTHVTVAIVERLPMPRPARDDRRFRELAALAAALAHDPRDRACSATLQGLAARIYGLTMDEFARVLRTFPLVDTGERQEALEAFSRTL
ncbi:MAG: N-6 DNA methylase [Vicinamibacterales bacterium]